MHGKTSAGNLCRRSAQLVEAVCIESTHSQRLAFLHRKQSGRGQRCTLDEVLLDLERQYPGIRFRIIDEQQKVRRHIRIFVNGVSAELLSQKMQADDDVLIVQALSGG